MLKNALSNGYSSQIRGWLIIDGVQHELAQVGPDFCILQEPVSGNIFFSADVQAELIVEVDGDRREIVVLLFSNPPPNSKKLRFRAVQAV